MSTKSYYISTATDKILSKEFEKYTKYFAKQYKMDSALIRAIVEKESRDYFGAIRYEKHLRKAKWYLKTLTKEEKKDSFSYCSLGKMQVLFGIAKSYGFKGKPFELLEPKNSLVYGVMHLNKLIKRYEDISKAVSAYNQGTPRKWISGKKKGQFVNQAYVDDVLKYYKKFGGK